jgi:hypothetical protein
MLSALIETPSCDRVARHNTRAATRSSSATMSYLDHQVRIQSVHSLDECREAIATDLTMVVLLIDVVVTDKRACFRCVPAREDRKHPPH